MPTRRKNPPDNLSKNLPPNVQVALDALHSDFAEFVREVDNATKYPCREMIDHGKLVAFLKTGPDCAPYAPFHASAADWDTFRKLSSRHPELDNQFSQTTAGTAGNPSANVRAFFDFRGGVIAAKVLQILAHLIEIGQNHGLKPNAFIWAKAQISELLRRNLSPPVTHDWLRVACGGPGTDVQSLPMFLLMEPAGPEGFYLDHAWELMDAATARKVADAFHEEWWDGLRRQLRFAIVEAVKHQKPRSTEGGEALGGKGRARKVQGRGGKKRQPVFHRQELIKRYEEDKKGALFSPGEAAFLRGCSKRTIGRRVADGTLKRPRKSVKIFAWSFMLWREQEESQGGSGNPPKEKGAR